MDYYWPVLIGVIIFGKIALAVAGRIQDRRPVASEAAIIVRRGSVRREVVALDTAKEQAVEELVREGWKRRAAVSALASIGWRGYPSVATMVQQAWKSMPGYNR